MRKLVGAAALAASAVACTAVELEITNPNSASAARRDRRSDGAAAARHGSVRRPARHARRLHHEHRHASAARCTRSRRTKAATRRTTSSASSSAASRSSIRPASRTAPWGGEYGALRDIYNFKNTIDAAATLTRGAEVGGARLRADDRGADAVRDRPDARLARRHHRDQGESVRPRAVRVARLDVQVHPEHARRRGDEAGGRRRGVPVHARRRASPASPAPTHVRRRVHSSIARQGEGGGALRDGGWWSGGVAGGAHRARRVVPERGCHDARAFDVGVVRHVRRRAGFAERSRRRRRTRRCTPTCRSRPTCSTRRTARRTIATRRRSARVSRRARSGHRRRPDQRGTSTLGFSIWPTHVVADSDHPQRRADPAPRRSQAGDG